MHDPRNHIKKSAYHLNYDVEAYSSNYEESESGSEGGSSYYDEYSDIDFDESIAYTDQMKRKGSKDSAGRPYLADKEKHEERREKRRNQTREERDKDTQRSMHKFVKKRNKRIKYGRR